MKDKRRTTIQTLFGEVTFERNYYLDREQNRYTFLLDSFLAFDGSQSISPCLEETAVVFRNQKSSHKVLTDSILVDKTKTGKQRDWQGKKRRSQLTAEHFDKAGLERKAERMNECADTLVFKSTPEGLKLYQAWFCKVRLCPMCNGGGHSKLRTTIRGS